ncbi:MAG: purine-nucleoside phosphorylase [Desulfobacteraceae bacterium]|nr:purine-nucleoside phosphorylase [Desulfobacteraceae bacterium]
MKTIQQQVIETAIFIQPRLKKPLDIGLLTGTGLSETLSSLKVIWEINYQDLPNFPQTTVESHRGKLVYGTLAGKSILVMQGRFHLYEGYTPQEVTFPIRLMQELKIKTLILSNAAGGINLNFSPGDIMLISDHINLTGRNPLLGPQEPKWGIQFPDMTRVYDKGLMNLARKAAANNDLILREGIYAGLLGPSLETPGETRFLKIIGGDAVGFSTIMEAIAGVHAGMKILGLSLITNINNPDAPEQTTLEAVVETAQKASKKMNQLLDDIISQMI